MLLDGNRLIVHSVSVCTCSFEVHSKLSSADYWQPVFPIFTIFFVLFPLVSQGTLRFFMNNNTDNEQAWSSGIVEIYYSGSWGNICDDSSFGPDEAAVICHQLSYSGASSYTNTGSSSELVSCFPL